MTQNQNPSITTNNNHPSPLQLSDFLTPATKNTPDETRSSETPDSPKTTPADSAARSLFVGTKNNKVQPKTRSQSSSMPSRMTGRGRSGRGSTAGRSSSGRASRGTPQRNTHRGGDNVSPLPPLSTRRSPGQCLVNTDSDEEKPPARQSTAARDEYSMASPPKGGLKEDDDDLDSTMEISPLKPAPTRLAQISP